MACRLRLLFPLDGEQLPVRRGGGFLLPRPCAILLPHNRFAAAVAEALTNRRGFGALQRQCLTATRSSTAVIRLAHSILSPTIPQLENRQAGISPAPPPYRPKNLPRPKA